MVQILEAAAGLLDVKDAYVARLEAHGEQAR
jgi:hypothetical protein